MKISSNSEETIQPLPQRSVDSKSKVVFFCICFLTFGSYWIFDTPGAIPTSIQKHFEDGGTTISELEILSFYSIYSLPNIFLAIFGRDICERIGLRKSTFIFSLLICCGQTLFAYGIDSRSWIMAFIGRFLYGLGGETLASAQTSFIFKWFKGHNLAIAFAIVVSFARLGNTLNFFFTPKLSETSTVLSIWTGFYICLFSLFSCFVLLIIDYNEDKANPYFAINSSKNKLFMFKFSDIKKLPALFWLLSLICVLFYAGIFSFNAFGSKVLQHGKHMKFDEPTASSFLGVPNAICVVLSPLFGEITKGTGRTIIFIILSTIMLISSMYALFALTSGEYELNPAIILVWHGIGYAIGSCSIWSGLSFIIDDIEYLPFAFALMASIQNLGMTLFPFLIGFIKSNYIQEHERYDFPILFFCICETIAFILALLLFYLDHKWNNGKLNSSAARVKEILLSKQKRYQRHQDDQVSTTTTTTTITTPTATYTTGTPLTGVTAATMTNNNNNNNNNQTNRNNNNNNNNRILDDFDLFKANEKMRELNREQTYLLARNIASNRSAYYQRLGVDFGAQPSTMVTNRVAFM